MINDASAWWLGDWLVYGQTRYPDRYRRAIAETSLHYKTLRNHAWVSRKIEPERRRDALSFQHHAEVAALPADQQDAWLSQAEECGWSVAELRRRFRAGSRTAGDRLPRAQLGFDLDAEQRRRWESAAERAGRTLDDWISAVLDEETGAILRSETRLPAPAVESVPLRRTES